MTAQWNPCSKCKFPHSPLSYCRPVEQAEFQAAHASESIKLRNIKLRNSHDKMLLVLDRVKSYAGPSLFPYDLTMEIENAVKTGEALL